MNAAPNRQIWHMAEFYVGPEVCPSPDTFDRHENDSSNSLRMGALVARLWANPDQCELEPGGRPHESQNNRSGSTTRRSCLVPHLSTQEISTNHTPLKHIRSSLYQDTCWGSDIHMQICSQYILQPQPTGQPVIFPLRSDAFGAWW